MKELVLRFSQAKGERFMRMKVWEKIVLVVQGVLLLCFVCWQTQFNATDVMGIDILATIGAVLLSGLALYACTILLFKIGLQGNKVKRAFYFAFAAISIVLYILAFPQLNIRHDDVEVTIECGDRGMDARDAEVWISAWAQDGTERSVSSLQPLEIVNLLYRDDHNSYLYSNSDGSGYGKIVFRFPGNRESSLTFETHPWCGKVRISTNANDHIDIVDLYNTASSSYIYQLPQGNLKPLAIQFIQALMYLALYSTIVELIILVLLQLIRGIIGGICNLLAKQPKNKGQHLYTLSVIFVGISGALIPTIYLMFQFVQNPSEVNFLLVAAVCAVSAVLFFATYIVLYILSDSYLVSYIGCVLLAVWMFTCETVRNMLIQPNIVNNMEDAALLIVGGLCAAILGLCIWKMRKIKLGAGIGIGIACFTIFMFISNVPAAVQNYKSQLEVGENNYSLENFAVDAEITDKPNVYWFHCDGMLGFSAYEKYYKDDQREWKDQLHTRGFAINEDACFEAGHATVAAIPALMSPGFYDDYLNNVIQSEPNQQKLHNLFDGPEYGEILKIARLNNELIAGFDQGGYNTAIIAPLNWGTTGTYFPTVAQTQYDPSSNVISIIDTDPEQTKRSNTEFSSTSFYSLKNFLHTLMLPADVIVERCLPKGYETLSESAKAEISSKEVVATIVWDAINASTTQALTIALERENSPYLFIIPESAAHNPFDYNEDGQRVHVNNMNVLDYPPQHRYAEKILLYAIDAILSKDPDAVIILQADHGLHGNIESEFKEAFGDEAVATELWNQVFSAIRIPEKYRNGEEAYAESNPLNITRYLVNRFVGKNYEYLPADDSLLPNP